MNALQFVWRFLNGQHAYALALEIAANFKRIPDAREMQETGHDDRRFVRAENRADTCHQLIRRSVEFFFINGIDRQALRCGAI